jgi:hypothetical protein
MSIAQNLKILNKPINEIAMLSQETIMAMAQAGQIPVAFVAPILAEKAEQAKAGANMAAMAAQQQMPTATVLEDIIAQNAASEAKAAMPEMSMGLPEDTGIASLPVPDESMPSEFASGGIVAFEAGGDVDYSQFGDIGEELKRQEALRKMFLGENEALRAEREGMDAAERQQRAFRLIETGLGIAGGESPYFAANLKGGMSGVRGMAEDAAAQRKRRAELAGMERAEKGKVLESAMGAVQAREKLAPETIREARAIQDEARKAGKKVPTLAQAIKSIERTTGTATLQSAMLNAQAKRATARTEALKNLSLDPAYNRAKKKGDTDTVRRMEREARARVDAQYADFLPPGVDVDESAAPAAAPRAKPTMAEFLKRAKEVNPGVSEADLKKYYNETYGG